MQSGAICYFHIRTTRTEVKVSVRYVTLGTRSISWSEGMAVAKCELKTSRMQCRGTRFTIICVLTLGLELKEDPMYRRMGGLQGWS